MALLSLKRLVGAIMYPPGSIYITMNDTNPKEIWGGEWELFSQGRTLIGVNENDTDFATVKKTGGTNTHTLSVAELPKHTHTFTGSATSHSHVVYYRANSTTGTGDWGLTGASKNAATSSTSVTPKGTNSSVGGAGAHNNIQPSIVVYMWRRLSVFPTSDVGEPGTGGGSVINNALLDENGNVLTDENYNILVSDITETIVDTITFTIDDIQYTAIKGMTWREWIESEYSPDYIEIQSNFMVNTNDSTLSLWLSASGHTSQDLSYIIVENANYIWTHSHGSN
jgi:hypothetical protein